jgi:predicted 3-demethylubiquinone-9 3-methyltransferase (glyoxalase superfamily)
MQKITPFLWFDNNAEEALNFYAEVFKDSKILNITRTPDRSADGKSEAASVMVASVELAGQKFTLMNGGPLYKFNESVSFMVNCEDQAEVDYFWEKLTSGGGKPVQCGWLKDKYGLSWQITPVALMKLLADKDRARAGRVFQAMMKMTKIDIPTLERAAEGKS